jgi:protein subunit release factor A
MSQEFISNSPLGVIRVPETEKSGRLHSSTASVVVLPDKAPVRSI